MRSAYLSNSDLARTAEVTHHTIRCLVSKPNEHCGNIGMSAKNDNLYSRSGPSKSSAPWCSFEAISIDRRRQRDSLSRK